MQRYTQLSDQNVNRPKDTSRQIKAMLHKNLILKKAAKGGLVMDILFPVIIGYIFYSTANSEVYNTAGLDPQSKEYFQVQAIRALIFPLMMVFYVSLMVSIGATFLIQNMVEEKENRMRETLRIMSLTPISYGGSFMLFQMIFSILGGVIVGAFCFGNDVIFPIETQWRSIQFVILLIGFQIAQIPVNMSISTMFSNAKVANYVGAMIVLVPIVIFFQFATIDGVGRNFLYLLFVLPQIPTSCLVAQLVTDQDIKDQLPFLAVNYDWVDTNVCWMAIALAVPFWLGVYIWLDQVMPNTYGVQKKPCFCLQKKRSSSYTGYAAVAQQKEDGKIYNSQDPIILDSLTKKFGGFTAVNQLSFSIKEGEIFTILGHNGAGKTTAIFMLTGMLTPSSGDATVYGNKLSSNIDAVQQNLGLCQQFDVLFDKLTILEHLKLVCELKNIPSAEIAGLITETLSVVMLTEHQMKKVKELSGGMKRKLSLAMAIVTKPKVIILDEPTSGLDVESRRQTWELIKRIKVGRSVIMSSQHLEEADELADRICIMTKGQLLALDRPEQIKQQFGVGYKLLIEPKTEAISSDAFITLKNQQLDAIILSQANQSVGVSENGDSTFKKLIYQIPFKQVNMISPMLQQLESQFGHVAYIDIEMNSLEDAYINIAKEEEKLFKELQSNGGVMRQSMRERMSSINHANKTNDDVQDIEVSQREDEALKQKYENNLSRYIQQQATPQFHRQCFSNFKRRLLQFIKSTGEIIIDVQMVLTVLVNIMTIQVILNIVKATLLKSTDDPDQKKDLEKTFDEVNRQVLGNIFPFLVAGSLILSSGLFVVTPVKDREDKLRYLLNFAGISSAAYYIGMFFADMIIFVVPTILIILLSFVLQIDTFTENAGRVIPVFIAFGISYIPLSYLTGFCFKNADAAFKYNKLVMMLYTGVTAAPYIWVDPSSALAGFGFWVSPVFSFFINIAFAVNPSSASVLGYDSTTTFLLSVLQFVVFMALTILIDYLMVNSFKGMDSNQESVQRNQLNEGQDVKDHQAFTKSNWQNQEYPIKSDSLYKVYGNGVAAVNKNTFCVKKGEVFALLGPNGAGKSSMFNIMTMDLKRTSGGVQILNTDLDNVNVGSQGFQMGMCPQFNTIWNALSVDQSISFIGEIKGLSAADIEFQKEFIKETLDLGAYSNIRAMNLSGGNKRKLICAMSLVACPKVEFLDEPTTGVDPVSRRSLFKMLKSLQQSSMILTTHRMDEAESLCDNIAIMINGRFVCYGSPGHLKTTYGQGYSITLKHLQAKDEFVNWISTSYNFLEYENTVQTEQVDLETGAKINESFFKVKQSVPIQTIGGLSALFQIICTLKDNKTIKDFTITRSSLETVFVQFAKHQIEQVVFDTVVRV